MPVGGGPVTVCTSDVDKDVRELSGTLVVNTGVLRPTALVVLKVLMEVVGGASDEEAEVSLVRDCEVTTGVVVSAGEGSSTDVRV